MTTKDYLDEYAGCYRVVDNCEDDGYGCKMCLEDRERMQEIIQELEANIRKEVVLDILKLAVNTPEKVNELNVALDSRSRQELYLKAVGYWDCIKAVKEYALSKGITLK